MLCLPCSAIPQQCVPLPGAQGTPTLAWFLKKTIQGQSADLACAAGGQGEGFSSNKVTLNAVSEQRS